MASSEKTDYLRLNCWSLADSPKMSDFNEDNRKLDAFAGSVPTREQLRPNLIYPAVCRFQEGAFHLDGIPGDISGAVTVRFTAPVSYAEGQEFRIGERRLLPCGYDFSPLPDNAFKATAIVLFEADMEGGKAFFRTGGATAGGGEATDQKASEIADYIFFGDAPPEGRNDGLFVQLDRPIKKIIFATFVRRKGEYDRRFSFSMPAGRYSLRPFLYGNRLYCIGGRSGSSVFNTVYILNVEGCGKSPKIVENSEWSIGNEAPVNLADYMLEVVGDRAYLIGGRTPGSSKAIYSYHMDTDQWREEGELSGAVNSLYFSGSVVSGGIIYLFFGVRNGASSSTQSYALDPETLLMTELAANPNGSTWAQAVEKDGIAYVVGRTSTVTSNKAGIFAYHIESNLWTTLYSDPQNRAYMGVCRVESLIYMLGGLRNSAFGETPMSDIRAYDIESGLWCELGGFLQRRHGMGVVAGPEGIYCVGGGISTSQASGEGLSTIDILWSGDDVYPEGTMVVEYGVPSQNVPLYEAGLGRSGITELVMSVRRVFYSQEGALEEVPFMVRRDGAEWRGTAG